MIRVGWAFLIAIGILALCMLFGVQAEEKAQGETALYLFDSETVHLSSVFKDLGMSSIAFDRHGYPHIVYGKDALYHAWYDNGHWQVETVDINSGWQETYAAIAIREEEIHVSYSKDGRLHYAHWDGTRWETETLESRLYTEHSAIALEPQSPYTVHIVYGTLYYNGFRPVYTMWHAWHDGSGWSSEVMKSGDWGYHIVFRLSPTEPFTPHVAYVDRADPIYPSLKYGWRDAQGWHIESVSEVSPLSDRIDMELVPVAPYTPCIAYIAGHVLRLSVRDGTEWDHFDRPGSEIALGVWGLEIEPLSPFTRHIVYNSSDMVDGLIKHLWGLGELVNWESETFSSDGKSGGVMSLLPTSPYTPVLIYVWDSDLYSAQLVSPTWVYTTIDHNGVAGAFNEIVVEPVTPFTPHIAYVYRETLYHTSRSAMAWESQIIDAVESLHGQHVALALMPTAPFTPCVSYSDADSVLKYGCWDGSKWQTQTVVLEGWYPSLAFVPTSPFTPHISYVEPGDLHLAHAWWDGQRWLTETVNEEQVGGLVTSLGIAPVAPYTLHIGYYNQEHSTISHAWSGGGSWLTQTVDYLPHYCEDTMLSLALEPVSPFTVHIGYMFDDVQARYARLDHSGIHTETIGGEFNLMDEPVDLDLVLNPLASYEPYVLYSIGQDGYLAHKQGNHWIVQNLRWGGYWDTPPHSSLALLPAAPVTPLISYRAFLQGDLVLLSGRPTDIFVYMPVVFREW